MLVVTKNSEAPPVPKTGLRRRRTLNRLALAGLALLVAGLGQSFFRRQSLWDGLLFYGVAVVLFIWAFRGRGRTSPDWQTLVAGYYLDVHAGWRRNAGLWLMALAVGVSIISFKLFNTQEAPRQAWGLYWGSLGLFLAGGLVFTRGCGWRKTWRRLVPTRQIAWGLGVTLALALFMRLYHFTGLPFGIWYDEAEAGLQARQILTRADYRPLFYAPINITGHLLALYALALRWLGDNIYSMRLVSVLFGVGGVIAAYLAGRELRGPRFGLALAFMVAVARWHVNFSRIAMTGIDTPFFEFLSLYFLARLLRRGRLHDAMWAGLSLGLGLLFYTAFRLYVAALGAFAMIAALYWRSWLTAVLKDRTWTAHGSRLAIFALTAWLVAMPLIQFALTHPAEFWYRPRQISIFTRRDQPDLAQALWNSTRKHLLMFNYQGDKNGRHNLPGEPMLDPLTGMLFVLGAGLALARHREPANAFFLLLFPLGLAGGIFSVDFEAPQSLRSIAVMPSVFYFAALTLAELGREAKTALRPLPRGFIAVPAAALAGFILFNNANTYFNRQANDFASWNAFSAPETITGRKMAELGPNHLYLLSPFLANHPTTRFIAPNITNQHPLSLPDALPIREPPVRPVTLFIHPDDVWVFDKAQQLYPNATFEIARGHTAEGEGPPIVYRITLQPSDLSAVQGLELRYFRRLPDAPRFEATEEPPLQSARAYVIQANWPADASAETNFLARWYGVLYASIYGPYSFRLVSPGPAKLEIDGHLLLEGNSEQVAGLTLAQGNHTISLWAEGAAGEVALYWQPPGQHEELVPQWALYAPPVANHGLLGTYYPNDRWEGRPALQRVDPFLDTYFHFTPLHRPYTVEWTGMLDVPRSGLYVLGVRAITEAQLFLDDQLLLTTIAPDQLTEASATLDAGLHNIRVLYKDATDRSRIHLMWTTPDGASGPIPSENLWPPLGRYPERTTPPPVQADIQPLSLEWIRTIGGPGSESAQFLEPRDIAVLSNGNLVVADTGNRRLQILSPQGTPLQILTGDPFPFEEPLAVGVNSRDEILALDSTLQWVYRYDAQGNLLDRFGGPEAYLFHPRGMTVFDDNVTALADTGKSRIALFTPDGQQAGSIGGLGNGPGQFNEPTDVLRDAQGTYFVAEAMNNRIQRVDADGNYLSQWAIPDAYAYNGPHMAFGPDGSLFVTESQSRSLLRYSPTGDLLDVWQSIGPVALVAPVGIYFDPRAGLLYLTDIGTHQVHVFVVQVSK